MIPNPNKYDTQLSPSEEMAFTLWVNKQYPGKKVEDVTSDYDLRGAWREINAGKIKFDERGHLPDKYKKPNHITFSNESIYHNNQTPGGRWYSTPSVGKNLKENYDQWHFQPSEHNIKTHGKQKLEEYFKKNESGVKLMYNNPSPQENSFYSYKK